MNDRVCPACKKGILLESWHCDWCPECGFEGAADSPEEFQKQADAHREQRRERGGTVNQSKDLFEGIEDAKVLNQGPKILACSDDGDVHERASTQKVLEVEVHHAFEGLCRVQVFESVDDEDRGGLVLRFETENFASAFHLYVTEDKDNAVDIHFAGDNEAAGLVEALSLVVDYFKTKKPRGSVWSSRVLYGGFPG